MKVADARRLALALPEATEEPHHGAVSYRVRGKIFATVPDETHWNVMLGEDEIREACEVFPDACEGQLWGKKLAALRVDLNAIDADDLRTMLERAWKRRAPKKLHGRLPSSD